MVYAKFGGQTECIMGNWKIVNTNLIISRHLALITHDATMNVNSSIVFLLSVCRTSEQNHCMLKNAKRPLQIDAPLLKLSISFYVQL